MNMLFILQAISIIQYCIIISVSRGVAAFQLKHHCQVPINRSIHRSNHNLILLYNNNGNDNNNIWSGISSLWDEIIEMSTYGPSERKMLKVQRERQMERQNEMISTRINSSDDSTTISNQFDTDNDDDQAWLEAFTSAKDDNSDTTNDKLDYDGYQLRDLLVSKWGVPNDIDFQRMNGGLYCTILPVLGYGNALQSRHENELQYLMHLQGIVEVLNKYDVLEDFVYFVTETDKRPKRGTDSVPYRLDLSRDDIVRLLHSNVSDMPHAQSFRSEGEKDTICI